MDVLSSLMAAKDKILKIDKGALMVNIDYQPDGS